MSNQSEFSNRLQKVLNSAIRFAAKMLEGDEPMSPFILKMIDEKYVFGMFAAPGIENPDAFARESARRNVQDNSEIDAYVLCLDGYVHLREGRKDALILECSDREQDSGFVFIQPYNRDDDGKVVMEIDFNSGLVQKTAAFFPE